MSVTAHKCLPEIGYDLGMTAKTIETTRNIYFLVFIFCYKIGHVAVAVT